MISEPGEMSYKGVERKIEQLCKKIPTNCSKQMTPRLSKCCNAEEIILTTYK